MKLFVHYDESGQVLSVAKVYLSERGLNPFMHVDQPENVLEMDAAEDVGALDAHEIAERYEVDVKKRTIKEKAGTTLPAAKESETRRKTRKP